jgi:hypothetical protein
MNNTEKRELVINTVSKLTRETGDVELMKGVKQLCIQFFPEGINYQMTLDGMVGFIHWCEDHPEYSEGLKTTLIHDLSEFVRNRNESWYCPRSYNYAKFIKQ